MRVFPAARAPARPAAAIVNGQLVPSTYAASITHHKTRRVRMRSAAATSRRSRSPRRHARPRDAFRSPKSSRRGVLDPMTGSIYRIAAGEDPMTPSACSRSVAIFDGRMRYELTLAYQTDGPGQARSEATQARSSGLRDLFRSDRRPSSRACGHQVSGRASAHGSVVAPIAGTSVLVPYRFEIPTPVGYGRYAGDAVQRNPATTRITPTGMASEGSPIVGTELRTTDAREKSGPRAMTL